MGLFNKKNNDTSVQFKLVTQHSGGFYSWNGKLYESDIIRSCIRPKVKAISKLTPKHIYRQLNGVVKENKNINIKFLLEDPNPLMSMQQMLVKVGTQLALNNNAFIAIEKNEDGIPYQLWPLISNSVQPRYSKSGELYLIFYLTNGKVVEYPYTNIIHLKEDYNSDDIFGESQAEALVSLMNVVKTTDQGIVKAIKNSALIRWLFKVSGLKDKGDIESKRKDLAEQNFNVENNESGILMYDGFFSDATQVKPENYVPNAAQMDRTTARIYNLFNTNEKIVQSKFTEDEWNAYYEAEIEPVVIQLSRLFTNRIFSRKERAQRNSIEFEAMNLQYASMQSKLKFSDMVDRGAMTPNEWRSIMNLGPIEGGDRALRRKDTGLATEEGGSDNGDNQNQRRNCA